MSHGFLSPVTSRVLDINNESGRSSSSVWKPALTVFFFFFHFYPLWLKSFPLCFRATPTGACLCRWKDQVFYRGHVFWHLTIAVEEKKEALVVGLGSSNRKARPLQKASLRFTQRDACLVFGGNARRTVGRHDESVRRASAKKNRTAVVAALLQFSLPAVFHDCTAFVAKINPSILKKIQRMLINVPYNGFSYTAFCVSFSWTRSALLCL